LIQKVSCCFYKTWPYASAVVWSTGEDDMETAMTPHIQCHLVSSKQRIKLDSLCGSASVTAWHTNTPSHPIPSHPIPLPQNWPIPPDTIENNPALQEIHKVAPAARLHMICQVELSIKQGSEKCNEGCKIWNDWYLTYCCTILTHTSCSLLLLAHQ
jgi:hypothetical protein